MTECRRREIQDKSPVPDVSDGWCAGRGGWGRGLAGVEGGVRLSWGPIPFAMPGRLQVQVSGWQVEMSGAQGRGMCEQSFEHYVRIS